MGAKMLICHSFYKENWILTPKMSIFHRFYKVFQTNVAVAAAAWCERPPNCSESITFFRKMLLVAATATFFVHADPSSVVASATGITMRQDPLVHLHCLGNIATLKIRIPYLLFSVLSFPTG